MKIEMHDVDFPQVVYEFSLTQICDLLFNPKTPMWWKELATKKFLEIK